MLICIIFSGLNRFTVWVSRYTDRPARLNKIWLVLLLMLSFRVGDSIAAELDALPQAAAAPPLALSDLGGKTHSLDDLRGKVVLVNFWASWCQPCIAEMPSMQRLAERMKDQPFVLLAVNVEESKTTVRRFKKLLKLDFTTLLDTHGAVAGDWQVAFYPTSYLIDPDGRIRYVVRGALEWDEPDIIRTLQGLLHAAVHSAWAEQPVN